MSLAGDSYFQNDPQAETGARRAVLSGNFSAIWKGIYNQHKLIQSQGCEARHVPQIVEDTGLVWNKQGVQQYLASNSVGHMQAAWDGDAPVGSPARDPPPDQ